MQLYDFITPCYAVKRLRVKRLRNCSSHLTDQLNVTIFTLLLARGAIINTAYPAP